MCGCRGQSKSPRRHRTSSAFTSRAFWEPLRGASRACWTNVRARPVDQVDDAVGLAEVLRAKTLREVHKSRFKKISQMALALIMENPGLPQLFTLALGAGGVAECLGFVGVCGRCVGVFCRSCIFHVMWTRSGTARTPPSRRRGPWKVSAGTAAGLTTNVDPLWSALQF